MDWDEHLVACPGFFFDKKQILIVNFAEI